MPYALLVSVIVGITNIIPFFGPYLGAVPSAILILTESPYKCVIFIVFIIILQQIDGNVIGPKILGDKVGVSSFWILFAILFFGSYWGVIGMIVGVPLFGVLYDLAKRIINFGLTKHGREDMMEDYNREFQTDSKEDKDKEEKKKNRFSELLKKKKGTD
jgi:predicted PurR-regulated permease PerM